MFRTKELHADVRSIQWLAGSRQLMRAVVLGFGVAGSACSSPSAPDRFARADILCEPAEVTLQGATGVRTFAPISCDVNPGRFPGDVVFTIDPLPEYLSTDVPAGGEESFFIIFTVELVGVPTAASVDLRVRARDKNGSSSAVGGVRLILPGGGSTSAPTPR